jgi:heptosyltransferase-2
MDHPVMLLGGKDDAAAGNEIASVDDVKVYNACGKFSINESADLVKKAKLVVTNDTGLMHIAAAFKRPIISLWGNTVPAFGMYPYYGDNFRQHYFDVFETKKLWCRPCSKIGYDKCPLGHFKCMQKIAADDIVTAVKRRL